ncbi:MAG: hypothetical protein ACI91B_002007 [Planctomycetota bacterium]
MLERPVQQRLVPERLVPERLVRVQQVRVRLVRVRLVPLERLPSAVAPEVLVGLAQACEAPVAASEVSRRLPGLPDGTLWPWFVRTRQSLVPG